MFKKILIALLLIPLSSTGNQGEYKTFENELLPFKTDGCSKFPDSFGNVDWTICCKAHDLAYWMGGTKEERAASDRALNKCVQEKGLEPLGNLMEAGVTVGGVPGLPSTWRWGYGWVVDRGYKSLEAAQWRQIDELAPDELSEVEVSQVGFVPIRQTVTGNYCLDLALSKIATSQGSHSLRYKVIAESESNNPQCLLKSFDIQTEKCPESYKVQFDLLEPSACTEQNNELLVRGRVRFKSLSLGCEAP